MKAYTKEYAEDNENKKQRHMQHKSLTPLLPPANRHL